MSNTIWVGCRQLTYNFENGQWEGPDGYVARQEGNELVVSQNGIDQFVIPNAGIQSLTHFTCGTPSPLGERAGVRGRTTIFQPGAPPTTPAPQPTYASLIGDDEGRIFRGVAEKGKTQPKTETVQILGGPKIDGVQITLKNLGDSNYSAEVKIGGKTYSATFVHSGLSNDVRINLSFRKDDDSYKLATINAAGGEAVEFNESGPESNSNESIKREVETVLNEMHRTQQAAEKAFLERNPQFWSDKGHLERLKQAHARYQIAVAIEEVIGGMHLAQKAKEEEFLQRNPQFWYDKGHLERLRQAHARYQIALAVEEVIGKMHHTQQAVEKAFLERNPKFWYDEGHLGRLKQAHENYQIALEIEKVIEGMRPEQKAKEEAFLEKNPKQWYSKGYLDKLVSSMSRRSADYDALQRADRRKPTNEITRASEPANPIEQLRADFESKLDAFYLHVGQYLNGDQKRYDHSSFAELTRIRDAVQNGGDDQKLLQFVASEMETAELVFKCLNIMSSASVPASDKNAILRQIDEVLPQITVVTKILASISGKRASDQSELLNNRIAPKLEALRESLRLGIKIETFNEKLAAFYEHAKAFLDKPEGQYNEDLYDAIATAARAISAVENKLPKDIRSEFEIAKAVRHGILFWDNKTGPNVKGDQNPALQVINTDILPQIEVALKTISDKNKSALLNRIRGKLIELRDYQGTNYRELRTPRQGGEPQPVQSPEEQKVGEIKDVVNVINVQGITTFKQVDDALRTIARSKQDLWRISAEDISSERRSEAQSLINDKSEAVLETPAYKFVFQFYAFYRAVKTYLESDSETAVIKPVSEAMNALSEAGRGKTGDIETELKFATVLHKYLTGAGGSKSIVTAGIKALIARQGERYNPENKLFPMFTEIQEALKTWSSPSETALTRFNDRLTGFYQALDTYLGSLGSDPKTADIGPVAKAFADLKTEAGDVEARGDNSAKAEKSSKMAVVSIFVECYTLLEKAKGGGVGIETQAIKDLLTRVRAVEAVQGKDKAIERLEAVLKTLETSGMLNGTGGEAVRPAPGTPTDAELKAREILRGVREVASDNLTLATFEAADKVVETLEKSRVELNVIKGVPADLKQSITNQIDEKLSDIATATTGGKFRKEFYVFYKAVGKCLKNKSDVNIKAVEGALRDLDAITGGRATGDIEVELKFASELCGYLTGGSYRIMDILNGARLLLERQRNRFEPNLALFDDIVQRLGALFTRSEAERVRAPDKIPVVKQPRRLPVVDAEVLAFRASYGDDSYDVDIDPPKGVTVYPGTQDEQEMVSEIYGEIVIDAKTGSPLIKDLRVEGKYLPIIRKLLVQRLNGDAERANLLARLTEWDKIADELDKITGIKDEAAIRTHFEGIVDKLIARYQTHATELIRQLSGTRLVVRIKNGGPEYAEELTCDIKISPTWKVRFLKGVMNSKAVKEAIRASKGSGAVQPVMGPTARAQEMVDAYERGLKERLNALLIATPGEFQARRTEFKNCLGEWETLIDELIRILNVTPQKETQWSKLQALKNSLKGSPVDQWIVSREHFVALEQLSELEQTSDGKIYFRGKGQADHAGGRGHTLYQRILAVKTLLEKYSDRTTVMEAVVHTGGQSARDAAGYTAPNGEIQKQPWVREHYESGSGLSERKRCRILGISLADHDIFVEIKLK